MTQPVPQIDVAGAQAPVRRVCVVLNPAAGRGQGARRRPEIERLLAESAATLPEPAAWEIVETQGPGDGVRLAAAAAAQGADVVAAVGGDGTLGETLNGLLGAPARPDTLARPGTATRLGVVPLGTGNDFARHIGVAGDLPRAIRTLFHGEPHAVDVGRVAGRWFLNIAGCGFDAVVAERINHGIRNLRGTPAYLAAVLLTLRDFRAARLRLTLDDQVQELSVMLCAVANTRTYGGGMRVTPEAEIDDGLFDICVVTEAGKFEFLCAFPRVFAGTHVTHRCVRMFRARQVRVETDRPLPLLADGEVIGTTPAVFEMHPGAITVMIPR